MMVKDLLFTDALVHALANLRMHTTFTLEVMELEVTRLGYELRRFADVVCVKYDTRELRKETEARVWAEARRDLAGEPEDWRPKKRRWTEGTGGDDGQAPCKIFSFNTHKRHNIGHYAKSYSRKGTGDNFNTKIVSIFLDIMPESLKSRHQGEMTHPTLKRWYRHRTNHRDYVSQLTALERIATRVREVQDAIDPPSKPKTLHQEEDEDDRVLPLRADEHHHISPSKNSKLQFDQLDQNDPAVQVCIRGVANSYFSLPCQKGLQKQT
jgi:hypothetical protein